MRRYQILADGNWCDPLSGSWFESLSPATGQPWALIPNCGNADVERAVGSARRAFTDGPWAKLSPSARGVLLNKVADNVAEQTEAIAEIEVRDNGKRIAEVVPQFRYLAQYFRYFAGLTDKIEGSVIPIDIPDVFNFTFWEPLGVIAAITPWNSPLMLAAWKVAPALAAGNTVVLKPSEHASASTLEFARILSDGGLFPGVINVVTGLPSDVGEPLVRHPDIAKISFTGSDMAGRRIAQLAAGNLKKTTLELGGKSPQIVFSDADITNAVRGIISGIFVSVGQSCVAGSRLIVHEEVKDRLLKEIVAAMTGLRTGDPLNRETQIGPMATRPQYEKVLEYIEGAKRDGASCILGGKRANLPGWFIEPTVFIDVRPDMKLWQDEVFGPVLAVATFRDEEEAVGLANDSKFGLAAGVWTGDMNRAFRLSRQLHCGTVYINNYRGVSALSPVGGYKSSGYGRENGIDAIKEYLQIKSVWIGTATELANPFPRQ